MGQVCGIAYLVDGQVRGDDKWLLCLVALIYDCMNLFHSIFGVTINAQVVYDEQLT